MVPVDGSGKLAGLQRLSVRWPPRLKQAAAVCNSLNLIGRNQVVGDLADKQAFKAVEARFQVSSYTDYRPAQVKLLSSLFLLCIQRNACTSGVECQ